MSRWRRYQDRIGNWASTCKKISSAFYRKASEQHLEHKFLSALGALIASIAQQNLAQQNRLTLLDALSQKLGLSQSRRWLFKHGFDQANMRPTSLEVRICQLRPFLLQNLRWRQLSLQALGLSCELSQASISLANFRHLAERLGYTAAEAQAVESVFIGAFESHKRRRAGQNPRFRRSEQEVAWAYQQLQLSPSASDLQIKTAYRRLMSRYHPDKVVARNLSTLETKRLTQKAQTIQKAYRCLMAARS